MRCAVLCVVLCVVALQLLVLEEDRLQCRNKSEAARLAQEASLFELMVADMRQSFRIAFDRGATVGRACVCASAGCWRPSRNGAWIGSERKGTGRGPGRPRAGGMDLGAGALGHSLAND